MSYEFLAADLVRIRGAGATFGLVDRPPARDYARAPSTNLERAMALTDRVKQILSWYGSDNPGVKTNLARMLNHGALGGTGKMVILPVDQGFEHGPARSFAPNAEGYDPDYHAQLAIDAGCNAYAAPLGFLEFVADRCAGQVPLILKLNNSDTLAKVDQPCSAITGSVRDAVRLGCTAIGYTIYPGSGQRNRMYEDLRQLILEAKDHGLPTVLWAYPRGAGLSKEGEQGRRVLTRYTRIGTIFLSLIQGYFISVGLESQ